MLGLVSLGMMSFGVSTAAEQGVVPTPPVRVSSIAPAAGTSSASSVASSPTVHETFLGLAGTISASSNAVWLGRTNLTKQSGDPTQAIWQKIRTTATADATKTSPLGTAAYKVAGTGVAFEYIRQTHTVSTHTTYTWGAAVAPGSVNWVELEATDDNGLTFRINCDLVNGVLQTGLSGSAALGGSGMTQLSNGFWYIWMTFTTGAFTTLQGDIYISASNAETNTGATFAATDYYYFAYAQLEAAPKPSSYIATGATAVTVFDYPTIAGMKGATSASSNATGPTVHEMVLGVAGTTNASSFVSASSASETIIGKNGTISASAVSVAIVGHPTFTSYAAITSASSNAHGSPEGITHVNGVLATTFYMNRRRRGSSGSFLLYPTPVASLSMQLRAGSTFVR